MPIRNIILIVVLIAVAAVVWAVLSIPEQTSEPSVEVFRDVSISYRLIEENYYRPINKDELLQGAVAGMVGRLDEFSSYIGPDNAEKFTDRIRGVDTGTGLAVEIKNARVLVTKVLSDSPAYLAGVTVNDEILTVDGTDISRMELKEVKPLLEGDDGTEVTLGLLRGDGTHLDISFVRGKFSVESVNGFYRDWKGRWVYLLQESPRIGYIRVREFVSDTDEQFKDALRQMGELDGLILDLRDNPGGLLPNAIELADTFISSGTITTEIRKREIIKKHLAHEPGTIEDIPLIVLVNSQTASAAEIVAGALKVNYRALLIGTRTRGKGCVQHMYKLPGGLGQINLTTKQFLVGDDYPISRTPGSDEWGIDVDEQIVIPLRNREEISRLRASVCTLPSLQPKTLPVNFPKIRDKRSAQARRLTLVDRQLNWALQILRDPEDMVIILRDRRQHAKNIKSASRRASTGNADE